MDRVAVYGGTRNFYPQMYTALKSLIINNRMDRVFLLTEDDEFPYPLPGNVYVVNVSGQDYFRKDGPNYGSRWTYMTLMRCALAHMFPEEDRMLWLDCDTIVEEDITDLFDMDLDGFYYAGALEQIKCTRERLYINSGVLLANLSYLRESGKEQEIIDHLNHHYVGYPDQDTISNLCKMNIKPISSEYNANAFTDPCDIPKIIHFAARYEYTNDPLYRKYENMDLPGT